VSRAWIVAFVVFAFHLATATIYGYHRDEFYYLAQGRRLSWGYVDNPPLTPFLYRVSDELFGSSRFAVSIIPALLHAGIVVLVAFTAREIGGNNRAILVASLAAAVAPVFVTTGHFLGTVTPEVFFGAATTFFVAKVIHTGDTRWWLAVGVAIGFGLLDHWTLGFLIIGLAAGFLLTPQRELLWSGWTALGALVALLIVLPNVVWQAQHDWVQLEFAGHLRDYGASLRAAPVQFVILGGAAILALPGLLWLLRDEAGKPYRAFAIAFLVALVLVTVTGGKEYYTAALFPVLIAAGGVWGASSSGWALPAWIVGIGIVTLPLSTPLLPLSTANTVRGINPEIGEMVGWEALVDRVAPIAAQHPGVPVITGNYSEAGAIELLGPARGMARPYSGHLTYWYWGQPDDRADSAIVVGIPDAFLRRHFASVERVATIETPHGVENEEHGSPVWFVSGRAASWDVLWPEFQHM
jgi:hypothetical protein